jgi:hypothetical protein
MYKEVLYLQYLCYLKISQQSSMIPSTYGSGGYPVQIDPCKKHCMVHTTANVVQEVHI